MTEKEEQIQQIKDILETWYPHRTGEWLEESAVACEVMRRSPLTTKEKDYVRYPCNPIDKMEEMCNEGYLDRQFVIPAKGENEWPYTAYKINNRGIGWLQDIYSGGKG